MIIFLEFIKLRALEHMFAEEGGSQGVFNDDGECISAPKEER